jgi:16S rRNA (cytosine1402-N4)-methyltransferase
VVEGVVTNRHGIYVDATLGGGGHSAALLDALAPEGRVIGIDQDPEACRAARARLANELERGRFQVVPGNFSNVEGLLRQAGAPMVDGLLLDLGVSSHQLDTPARGFSFREAGQLDMRMDPEGDVLAGDLVNTWDEADLRWLFRTYGEERRAARIARAVVERRPLTSTVDLGETVRRVVPDREATKTLARVFQALRIAVNAELEALEQALAAAARVLKPGGRIAVISYHSLEDRRVKRFFRYGNLEGNPVRDIYGNLIAP